MAKQEKPQTPESYQGFAQPANNDGQIIVDGKVFTVTRLEAAVPQGHDCRDRLRTGIAPSKPRV